MLEAIASASADTVHKGRDRLAGQVDCLSFYPFTGKRVWKPRRTGALSVPLVSPIHGGAHVERDERPREPTRLPTSPPLDPSSRRQKEPTLLCVLPSLLLTPPASFVSFSHVHFSRISSPSSSATSSPSSSLSTATLRSPTSTLSSSLSSLIIALST